MKAIAGSILVLAGAQLIAPINNSFNKDVITLVGCGIGILGLGLVFVGFIKGKND